ncbi:hypothetical protein LTR08_001019 [Meristemomyces frigidus]|nr:hypothetical protein LTR08_001019 [Meristemomyces frigidus]
MPRLAPSLLRQARAIDVLLPPLLPACRDLRSAENELRWLKDHAIKTGRQCGLAHSDASLKRLVARRARGEPIQYILGTEYFGDLELKCQPGVLIPRQETAASVTHLAQQLSKKRKGRPSDLHILDLCSGSGCIPLLFHHEFYAQPGNEHCKLHMVGADISVQALELARRNQKSQIAAQSKRVTAQTTSLAAMRFLHADVLLSEAANAIHAPIGVVEALQQLTNTRPTPAYEVLISNPPYISSQAFRTTTARSVRNFEPKLALVPDNPSSAPSALDGDVFYPRLLALADQLRTEIILFEVADIDQAQRVATLLARQSTWRTVEIWRDEPGATSDEADHVLLDGGESVPVRGAGNGRSVFAYRGAAAAWLQ